MKLRLLAATLVALTLTGGTALAQDTSSSKGQLSYALGFQFGNQLMSSGETLDINTVVKAVQDGYAKKTPTVPVEQMKSAYTSMMQRMDAKAKAAFEKASVDNKTKSDAFLAQNRSKPGVKVLPSGVQYRVMESGNGAKPTLASTVDLEVSQPYPLGERPTQPQPAQKTPSMKISQIPTAGIREVLMQMPAGSKWEIVVPSAFGNDPRTDMPPNLAAVYEVKLLSVK
ncbi:MAG: FKBP-type peptidyl-prolyl cis-trans isomerase [Xanthomonadaceae bacterium]|nr:FKBP-type peptidyl-prolyl cis-trans isomerase [Xanthomonadaceae bacterium]